METLLRSTTELCATTVATPLPASALPAALSGRLSRAPARPRSSSRRSGWPSPGLRSLHHYATCVHPRVPINTSTMVSASYSTKCATRVVTTSLMVTLLLCKSVLPSLASQSMSATNKEVSNELSPNNDADEHGAPLASYSLSSSLTQYTAWENVSPTAPTSCTD
jgi:hypothetical protein